MNNQDLDRNWVLQTARTTGFSVPTIHKLTEVCYLQNPTDLKTRVDALISSLQIPQKWFSVRINPVQVDTHSNTNIREKLKKDFHAKSDLFLPNMFFFPVKGPTTIEKHPREIIVDKFAAESMFTGANLYVPGFLRPLPKFRRGENFSIYGPNHIHVANGVTQYSHKEILEMKKGIGIKTTDSKFMVPSYRESQYYSDGIISDHSFGPFFACNLLMEFYNDDEQTIFDVCSAPGHKTAALSEIGYNKNKKFPKIISIDRSTKRLETLHQDIERLCLKNIQVIPQRIERLAQSHPELLNKADLLVMDPSCSALGTRPKLSITHTKEDYRSFFLLQRRLVKESPDS